MPALRERREDIPALAEYFLGEAAKTAGIQPRRITDDAMAVLQSYGWPGNVRHLRNIMEWLLIMNSGSVDKTIDESMLPPELNDPQNGLSSQDESIAIMSLPLREAREIFEKQYLMTQIARFGGNISRTASFIGMERSALHRKLKLLGIQNEEKVPA
jgi:two-component system nitrogen regulation response regulator NtrX